MLTSLTILKKKTKNSYYANDTYGINITLHITAYYLLYRNKNYY